MPINLTVEHIDTCLPCYLTDHHNREGECLIGVPVTGTTTVAEVYNALVDEALDAELPEGVTEDMVRSACREAVDNNSCWQEPFDDSLEDDEPDGDGPQAWFVLRWTEGEAPEPASFDNKLVRDCSVHELTQALRERGCAVAVFSQDDAPDDYDFSGVEGGFAAWLVEKADHIEEQMRVRGSDALHDALVADDRVKLAGDEVSDTDNVVRAVHGLTGDIPVGDEQAGEADAAPRSGGAYVTWNLEFHDLTAEQADILRRAGVIYQPEPENDPTMHYPTDDFEMEAVMAALRAIKTMKGDACDCPVCGAEGRGRFNVTAIRTRESWVRIEMSDEDVSRLARGTHRITVVPVRG